jgi:hypothetical protein
MLKSAMEIKNTDKNGLQIVGKKESVLINPSEEILKKTVSRVVLFNKPVEGGLLTRDDKVLIVGPGEYEVGGIEINGLSDGASGVIYSVVIDGVSIAILGQFNGELSDKKIEKIGSADVLLADIAGYGETQGKSLMKLAKSWGANYVVPYGMVADSAELKGLLNVSDNEGLEPVVSLKIDKDNLPEGVEMVLLKESA